MIRLSIIVPMYNVENYVGECLKSIFNQMRGSDVEVILVNDGSTDDTMTVVDSLISQQPTSITQKIKIITQENRGLSGARNSGIMIATGDFIYFLDSDDYISNDFFNIVLPILDEHIDIIEFNASFFYVKNNKKIFSYRKNIHKAGLNFISSDDMRSEYYAWQDWAVWYRVYNKRLWIGRTFPEGWLYEDALTVPFIYQHVKNVYSLDSTLIYYRNNPSSIMNTKNDKSIQSIDFAIQRFLNENESRYMEIVTNRFVIASIGVMINNIGINKSFFWILHNFKKLEKDSLKSIKSKKLFFINYFPFILIPYFKLKSKGLFK